MTELLIRDLCHWRRGLAPDVSHRAFHYGSLCPYDVVDAVLMRRHRREYWQLVEEAQRRIGLVVSEARREGRRVRSDRPASPESPTSLIERPPVMGREVLPLEPQEPA